MKVSVSVNLENELASFDINIFIKMEIHELSFKIVICDGLNFSFTFCLPIYAQEVHSLSPFV